VQRQMNSDVFISETKMVLPTFFFYFEAVIPNDRVGSRAKLFIFFGLADQLDTDDHDPVHCFYDEYK
jgi:hypothetical protein